MNPEWGSFDDFPSAVMLLFVAATADGWDLFMFQGMDANGIDTAPRRNDFSPAAFYFIFWLVLGCFTMMNLFVGSVCDNFSRVCAESDGSATMTDEQKQWVRTMQESQFLKEQVKSGPPLEPPTNVVQRAFFILVNSDPFDIMMTTIIMANVFVMSCDYHRIEEDPHNYFWYDTANHYFLIIYYVECVLKVVGLGVGGYFKSTWNKFDFFLVCVSLIQEYAVDFLDKYLPIPPMLLRIVRLARILRILRLLKRFKRLRDLIKTTFLSFPSLINIGALLGVVTFIYAVLGVQLFCFVKPGLELSELRNLRSIGNACLLLVQCLTGDGWSTLMNDVAAGPEHGCDPNATPSDCGNKEQSYIYFLSYMFFGTFVLLNLIVAVILEHFSALGNVNPDLVSASDITDFGETWASVWTERLAMMTKGTGTVPDMQQLDEASLVKCLMLAFPPLGVGDPTGMSLPDEARAAEVVRSLNLDFGEDRYIEFQLVIDALVRRSFTGLIDDYPAPPAAAPALALPMASDAGGMAPMGDSSYYAPSMAPPYSPSTMTGYTAPIETSLGESAELSRLRAAAQRAAEQAGQSTAEVLRLHEDLKMANSLVQISQEQAQAQARAAAEHAHAQARQELEAQREQSRIAEHELRAKLGTLEGRLIAAESMSQSSAARADELARAHAAAEAAAAEAAAQQAAAETARARAAAEAARAHAPPKGARLPPAGGVVGWEPPAGVRPPMPSPSALPPPAPYSGIYAQQGMPPAPLAMSAPPPPPGTPGIATQPRQLPPSGVPPPLPAGWHAVNSPAGTYYYNVVSRQVTWQPPTEWQTGPRRGDPRSPGRGRRPPPGPDPRFSY